MDDNGALIEFLVKTCGKRFVSSDPGTLRSFSRDRFLASGHVPVAVVRPGSTGMVSKILSHASQNGIPVVPVSSGGTSRQHGNTVPNMKGSIIMDLSRMRRIIKVDARYRVVMVEPGVTFGELVPFLRARGLRLLLPLHPRADKSVVAAALDREPIVIPRYQWDSLDPLLCTEVVFGNGDVFRTGSAAGPGTIKEQWKTGQAQKNPMGPTQFDPVRLIQGASGTMGVVTWATLKCERLPTLQVVHHLVSARMENLLRVQRELVKYRLCDEIVLLDALALGSLLEKDRRAIMARAEGLVLGGDGEWHLVFVVAGAGRYASEKVAWIEDDVEQLLRSLGLGDSFMNYPGDIVHERYLEFLSNPTDLPWRDRFAGAHVPVRFSCGSTRVEDLVSCVRELLDGIPASVYVQSRNQGTSCHVEIDLHHGPAAEGIADAGGRGEKDALKEKYLEITHELISRGAFFERPDRLIAPLVFDAMDDAIVDAMRKVKDIFDPCHVLNPGALGLVTGQETLGPAKPASWTSNGDGGEQVE